MATAEQDARAAAIVAAYTQVSQTLRAAVLAQVLMFWDSLKSWRDADIGQFVAAAVPVVIAGQGHMSALTGAYLNQLVALEAGYLGKPIPVLARDTTGSAVRNGSTPAEVYSRMGPTVWRALQQGDTIEAAISKGRDRLTKVAQTDMQLARTHASQEVMSKSVAVKGYRRVLTGDKSCALCVVASTRTYHKADLLPIHPGCDCLCVPFFASTPDPRFVDQSVLDAAYQEIQSRLGTVTTKAAALRELLIVHDHGELGPVLAVRDQHFSTAADLLSA